MSKQIVILSAFVFAANASAHDYWFSVDGDDYLLHRGHHYSQHEGDKEIPFDPSIITSARCLTRDKAQRVDVSLKYPVRIEGPCLAVVVTMDSGYWSQTQTGTKNQGKDKLSGVIHSWQTLESIKRIEAWDTRLKQPLSDELELIFVEDPFSLSVGDKLRLAVTLDGKPAPGVTVAYDSDPRGVTGKDGRINLKIRHNGMQAITASLEESIDSDKADKRVRSTMLMFIVK